MTEGIEDTVMDVPSPHSYEPAPFAAGSLDALLESAAREAPAAILVTDDEGSSTAGDIARRVRRFAGMLEQIGLTPGERVLVVAGAQSAALVALAGALRARLEPVLVPCGLGAVDLAARARAASAVALIGPSRYGDLDFGDTYLTAAALAESVRMIGTQGPDPVDGALDLASSTLDAMPDPSRSDRAASGEPPLIGTFEGPIGSPTQVMHRQASLLADALSLVEQAAINPSKRLLSTLPLSTLAGLVAGPFAALVGAAGLVLHGPFAAERFLATCDAEPGLHLVAPSMVGKLLEGALPEGTLSSLILVSRFASTGAFALPEPITSDRPVIDLYAFGEATVLAQRRTDGVARPPARVTDKSLSGGLGARLNRAQARTQGERY